MKKKDNISYIFIGVISFILVNLFLGSKYGIYDYLPNYHLFEMPNDPSGGDIFHEYIRWSLVLVLTVLIIFIIYSVNKNLGFELIKEIQYAIKKNNYVIFYVFLGFVIFFPLLSLLFDYINLSIGMISAKGRVFPIGHVIGFIVLMFIFYLNRNN